MRLNIFDRLSFVSLFIVIVLLPLFCLPFTNIPIETSKGLLLVVGLTACVIFWAIARFIDGKIVFPKSWLLTSGFGVAFIFLLSAVFSSSTSREVSLFGAMFDVGSFWFIFSAFILMFMSSIVFRTPKQAKTLLLGAILSSAFVLVFQGVYLFFPSALSLGILSGRTGNVLGSWNALGLFAGFSTLMFLLVFEFFPISKIEKILLEVFIALSMLLAVLVNFTLVWVLLGISSLIIFVYKVSLTLQKNEDERKHFPLVSFIVMIITLLFFISGSFIGNFIPSRLQITSTEIFPSFATTMSISKDVIAKHPIFGVGPNRFAEAWSMYKPLSINNTNYWNVAFDSGSGLLPTLTATTGLLGMLSWLIFLGLFLYFGIKSVLSSIKNGVNWEMMAFFVLSLYLFISAFFYYTGMVLFLLALAFTGIFIGLATSSSNREVLISFSSNHKKSFFSVFFLILVVILSVSISFKYLERFVSVSYFGQTLSTPTMSVAKDSINKALSLYSNDLYLRIYSQVYLVDLNSIASKSATLSAEDQAALKASFANTVNGALAARNYNPQNYQNFQMLGSVYQATGSYSDAVAAYQSASVLDPLDPSIKLSIADASFSNGKVQDAKDYANQALKLKPDYVDAYIVLSRIAQSEGDNSKALSYAQSALSITPDDKNLIQYVNSLSSSSTTTPATTTPTSTSTTTTPTKAKK